MAVMKILVFAREHHRGEGYHGYWRYTMFVAIGDGDEWDDPGVLLHDQWQLLLEEHRDRDGQLLEWRRDYRRPNALPKGPGPWQQS